MKSQSATARPQTGKSAPPRRDVLLPPRNDENKRRPPSGGLLLFWWTIKGSNLGPAGYEPAALTN